MALRAMYKGFKKVLAPLIINRPGVLAIDQDALNAELNTVFFPRSEQAVLGAKNWFNYTKETTTNNGVIFTNSNNQSCTLSGQATADQAAIEMGTLTVDKDTEFIFNGASSSDNAKIHMYVFDSTTNARPYTDSSKTTLQTNNCFGTEANSEIPFFAEAGHVIKIYARVQTTGTSVPSDTVFWPMVRLASDPDDTYAPYAMTNKELTDEVQLLTSETSLTPTGDLAGANADCDIRKVGSLVVGSLYVPSLALTADTWKDIGTIPVAPKHTTNFCMATVNGDIAVEAQINTLGEVRVRSHTGGASVSLRGELVYVAGLAANRSLPEATREVVPEEVTPEEEPVKKTTRKKSTAKADTEKEGE